MDDYDIGMHLPQRIENFFQGLETNNPEMSEEALETIKQLESKEFNEKIKELETDLDNDVKRLQDNCFKHVKMGDGVKNFEDLINTISHCENDVNKRLNEFRKDVKRFLIKWNQQKNNL